MAQDRPDAAELLAAVRAFLEEELLPTLDGRLRFHTLVSAKALGILEREVRDGPAQDAAEAERLRGLLGREGSLRDLETELARAIRQGDLDERGVEVIDHVRRSVRDKLTIANPSYLED